MIDNFTMNNQPINLRNNGKKYFQKTFNKSAWKNAHDFLDFRCRITRRASKKLRPSVASDRWSFITGTINGKMGIFFYGHIQQ
jgi:hypothetical protein